MKLPKKVLAPLLVLAVCLTLAVLPARADFRDVAPSSWYEGAITQLTQTGALKGYPDGTFRPNASISAAEFVSVAVRLAKLPGGQGQAPHWAADQLQGALQAGWYDWDEIPPTGETFDQPIPRQLAVKILMKALLPQARGDYNTESAKIRDFAAPDGTLANLVFMIAISPAENNLHLKILAALSRKLMHQDFRDSLLACATREEVLEKLSVITA